MRRRVALGISREEDGEEEEAEEEDGDEVAAEEGAIS